MFYLTCYVLLFWKLIVIFLFLVSLFIYYKKIIYILTSMCQTTKYYYLAMFIHYH